MLTIAVLFNTSQLWIQMADLSVMIGKGSLDNQYEGPSRPPESVFVLIFGI